MTDRDRREPMRIILGSSSPRRREILGRLVERFEIRSPEADETIRPGETPDGYAERVSRAKCASIVSQLETESVPGALVIAGDTIVTIDGEIIGKPADHADALRIHARLAGRTHHVVSALTLARCARDHSASLSVVSLTDTETTAVTFKSLSGEGIERYLERISYLDKAGAYALQEEGGTIVQSTSGSITNVIGLPLRLFFRMLAALDCAESVLISSREP